MSSTFKKLNTKLYQKPNTNVTEDTVYWKQYGDPLLIKEFGLIDYIHFSPVEPYYFAVTSSVRVQLYSPITKCVTKTISRFKENAYGGNFRSDGAFLCAGSEDKMVKLFDPSTRNLIRLYKGHTAPVHRAYFLDNNYKVVSFSDDKSVKLWDLSTEKQILTYSEHSDYIRAGATCAAVPDMVLSGGFDNMVKMYDTRTNETVFSVNHGNQIQSLLFLPSGGIFLSAGGTDIKIWDATAGGKLVGSISQHHKDITCMHLASDNKRLLSGSLDRHVKVYDINTFEVVHNMDYPNGILSLAVSKNDDTLVVGLQDGLLGVSRREEKQVPKTASKKKNPSHKYSSFAHTNSIDVVVKEVETEKESQIDLCLRKFCFSEALTKALLPYVARKCPEKTIATMQELIRRRQLHSGFAGRDEASILNILRFFRRNISDKRFTTIVFDALHIFLDVYGEDLNNMSVDIQTEMKLLKRDIDLERRQENNLLTLQGAMAMLFTSANVQNEQISVSKDPLVNLTPSVRAQKDFVVTIR